MHSLSINVSLSLEYYEQAECRYCALRTYTYVIAQKQFLKLLEMPSYRVSRQKVKLLSPKLEWILILSCVIYNNSTLLPRVVKNNHIYNVILLS